MSVVVPLPPDRSPPAARPMSIRRVARFLAAISVLCAAAAFPASSIFDLNAVTVAGNAAVPTDEVLRRANLRPGMSAFRVDAQAIRGRLREDPRIEDVTVAMRFPSRVQLAIRERLPVAALVIGEGYLLVTADGVVVTANADRGALPLLVVERFQRPSDVPEGTVLTSSEALFGARVAGMMREPLKDRVAALRVDGAGDAVLILRDGISVRMGGSAGIADRLETVPYVLDAIAGRGLRVESVDLRFPGSIVVQPARSRQENPPVRGIDPAMHRPSVP